MWRPKVNFSLHIIFKRFIIITIIVVNLNLIILTVYVRMSAMSVDTRREQKALDPLDLEWVLETDLRPFGRSASALNH